MDRKEFIKNCSYVCLSFIGLSAIPSCKPTKQVQGLLRDQQLLISKKEFELDKNGKISYRKSIVARADGMNYPIAVYRFSDEEFHALLLRCTHQDNELNMNGDMMSCPAHGSEFNKWGEIVQGPAEHKLQSFQVLQDKENLYIQL